MADFLSSQEVAECLGVTRRQVQNLAHAGRLPHVRHGRSIRFPRAAWQAWLDRQSREAMASLEQETADA